MQPRDQRAMARRLVYTSKAKAIAHVQRRDKIRARAILYERLAMLLK